MGEASLDDNTSMRSSASSAVQTGASTARFIGVRASARTRTLPVSLPMA
jgi:hypothetical protein